MFSLLLLAIVVFANDVPFTGLNETLRRHRKSKSNVNINTLANLPSSYDWRKISGDIPVRNQGGCGSCWAFSTVGPMEFLIKNKIGGLPDISEQALVSCNGFGFSCANGGWWAYDAFIRDGVTLESDFPYVARDIPCRQSTISQTIKVTGWGYVDPNEAMPSVDQMKSAIIQYGPLTVGVFVSNEFYGYRNGVFTANAGGGGINHGVTMIGWDDSLGAWLIRNSWGSGWGMGGHMYIAYGVSSIGDGAAYVTLDVTYPGCIQSQSPSPSPRPSPSPSPSPKPSPPYRNDKCVNSRRVYCNTNIADTTVGITPNPLYGCLAITSSGRGTWFYTELDDIYSTLTVNTFGSNYDTQLSVFSGNTCSNLTCAAKNDDYGGTYQSYINVISTINKQYFIVVHGYGAATGLVNLTVLCR